MNKNGQPSKPGKGRFFSSLFGGSSSSSPKSKEDDRLNRCTYADVDPLVFQGTFDCKVLRVYDGDTLWIAISSPLKDDKVSRVCCRLLGMDTPEIPRSHADAMTDEGKRAFAARDRVVQLVTNVEVGGDDDEPHQNASGVELPSLSDSDLQDRLDAQNTLVLKNALDMTHGTDKYGRYLVHLKTKHGENLSDTLIREGHARPFMVDEV